MADVLALASATVIASARGILGHKSNRTPAPAHGTIDNSHGNLWTWFLKGWRRRTTTNPNRRPTTCCRDDCGIVDSYGYGALIGGVAAYHLFPDFVGGKNDAMRKGGIENGRKVIELAMKTKGSSPFIAGELSLADLYLAPIVFYVSLTPDKDAVFNVDGFADWWTKIQALPSFKVTQPNLG